MEQAFDYLDAPVARVTGKDVPMPYAANLEKLALPSVAEVVEAGLGARLSQKFRFVPHRDDPPVCPRVPLVGDSMVSRNLAKRQHRRRAPRGRPRPFPARPTMCI